MKKNKFMMLCALFVAGTLTLTACGGTGNNGSEAPYQDETNQKVNDMYNNGGTNNGGSMNNGGTNNGSTGSDLEDAGRNLMDSIKDTGDAIRDGVNNLGNGSQNNNNNNNRANP